MPYDKKKNDEMKYKEENKKEESRPPNLDNKKVAIFQKAFRKTK